MSSATAVYRIVVRDSTDSSDQLVVTSVNSGTNPYIADTPTGDGASYDPLDGLVAYANYMVPIIDVDGGGGVRLVTSQLGGGIGIGSKAYVQKSSDGGANWTDMCRGYLSAIRFPDALLVTLHVSNSQRLDRNVKMFKTHQDGFAEGTPIVGSGIPNGWGPFTTQGDLWRFRVSAVGALGSHLVSLRFVSGRMATAPSDATLGLSPVIREFVRFRINQAALAYWTPTGSQIVDQGRFDLQAIVYDPADGSVVGTFTPVSGSTLFGATPALLPTNSGCDLILDWQGTLPSVNSSFHIVVLPAAVSDQNPLHFFQHPIDIVTRGWDDADIEYDSSAADDAKTAIGTDLRLLGRVRAPLTLEQVQNRIFGPLGLTYQMDATARRVIKAVRAKSTTEPSVTISNASLRSDSTEAPIFDLDESTIVTTVIVKQPRFWQFDGRGGDTPPVDNIVETMQEREVINTEAPPNVTREISYDLLGTLVLEAGTMVDFDAFSKGIAAPIFDRYGGGAPSGTLRCLDSVTADLGDEVKSTVSHQVNGTLRGGTRIVQVKQRTVVPGGVDLEVVDAGTNVAVGVVPAFTLTKDSTRPRKVANIALTNAATLAAAGILVMVLVGTGTSQPSGLTNLTSMDPSSETTLELPPFDAGAKVWVQLQGYKNGLLRTASSVHSVALDAIDAPTGLAVAPAITSDPARRRLTWAVGTNASACPVRVRARKTSETVCFLDVVLLAGSTGLDVTVPDTVATEYEYTVNHIEQLPWKGVSASISITETLNGTAYTLLPPALLSGYSGSFDANGVLLVNGRYGAVAVATELPADVEFAESVEMEPGSNAYGAYTTIVPPAPGVMADWTKLVRQAPSDQLRRKIKARTVRQGATPSDYCDEVIVDPFTVSPIPVYPDAPANGLGSLRWTDSDTGTQHLFVARAGQLVRYVFVYDRLSQTPPTSDPWPAAGQTPVAVCTPNPTTREISYTATKPANGYQRFLQFDPIANIGFSVGQSWRAWVDPANAALGPKISATVNASNSADLTVDVVAGPADWTVRVDVFEDNPDGTAIFTGSYTANVTLTKVSTGASALGGRVLTGRPFRRWWVKLTNGAGQVSWAMCSSDRNVIPVLDSLSLTWDESSAKLRARVKGAANVVSAQVEFSSSSSFSSPTTSTITIGDGSDVAELFTPTFAQRGRQWYCRVTPYNAPSLGGTAGVALIAETPVPVVQISGQEICQATIAIASTGVPTTSIDLPLWANSCRYKESTSSQPTDADVLSGGTNANGRQITVTGSALAIGANYFITVIPYSGASATDYQGASSKFKATRHDASASKTISSTLQALTIEDPSKISHYNIFAAGVFGNPGDIAHDATVDFSTILPIPDGVTITAVSASMFHANPGAPFPSDGTPGYVKVSLYRVASDHTETLLGYVQTDATGGWRTETMSLSESTTGRSYRLRLTFQSHTAGANESFGLASDNDLVASTFTYSYTMPSQVNAI